MFVPYNFPQKYQQIKGQKVIAKQISLETYSLAEANACIKRPNDTWMRKCVDFLMNLFIHYVISV